MGYSLSVKKRTKKPFSYGIFLFFAGVMALFVVFPATFRFVSSGFFSVAAPFWVFSGEVKNVLENAYSVCASKKTLLSEMKTLEEENARLKREALGYEHSLQRNIELEKMLSIKTESGLVAGVIERPNVSFYDTFLLDVGSRAGIKNGDTALVDKNTAVGTVVETYIYSSKVRLFSSPGRKTPALIGPKNISAELVGAGGGFFTVDMPCEADIRKNDAVTLGGLKDFIIGYISSIEAHDLDAFVTVYVAGPVNIFETKYVEIIR